VTAFADLNVPAVRPDDPGYDEARRVFNAMIDRRPLAILRCMSAADVAVGIRHAREKDLALSIRSGGHGVAGTAVCDGGIMLDLSRLRTIAVDPERRIAAAGPGLLLGRLDAATQLYGLATPLGACPAQASPGSPSVAASAGSMVCTACRATTSSPQRS
jgi:FAD/FMN-containing dehydrogenase